MKFYMHVLQKYNKKLCVLNMHEILENKRRKKKKFWINIILV